MPEHNKISRRDFLKVALSAVWGFILAACKFPPEDEPPATESPATEPPPTQAPETQAPSTEEPVLSKDEGPPEPEPTDTPTPTPEPCFSLLEPAEGAEFGKRGRITFVWEAQIGASTYKLTITLPNDLIEEYETEFTQFEKYLESLPMAGEYHWQVTALNYALEEICITEIFTFRKTKIERGGGGGEDGSDDGNGSPPPPGGIITSQ